MSGGGDGTRADPHGGDRRRPLVAARAVRAHERHARDLAKARHLRRRHEDGIAADRRAQRRPVGRCRVVIGQRGTIQAQNDVLEARIVSRGMDAVVLVVPLDQAASTQLLGLQQTQAAHHTTLFPFTLLDPLATRGRFGLWTQSTVVFDATGTERLRSPDLPFPRWQQFVRSHRRGEALF